MGQPVSDLVAAATIAAELDSRGGVSVTDPTLLRLITCGSEAVRRYLGRDQVHFDSAISERVRGYGRPNLMLAVTPIVEITSVTDPGGQVLDPTEYLLEDVTSKKAGMLRRKYGCWWNTALALGGLQFDDPAAGTQSADYQVVYAGGWVTPVLAPAFQANHTYALGDLVQPSGRNGHAYKCTTPGASGGTEPAIWSERAGATVTSGAAVFTEYALAVPLDVEHATILSVVGNWRGRGKYQRLNQETVNGAGVPWYDYTLPFSAKQLLDPYRSVLL